MLAGFFALFIQILRFYKLGFAIQGVLPHSEIVAKAMATAPNCHSEEQSDVGIPLNRNKKHSGDCQEPC